MSYLVIWDNLPLFVFLVIIVAVIVTFVLLLRKIIDRMTTNAAEHASTYGVAYVKGSALILIAGMTSFDETFRQLTQTQATAFAWWNWAIVFSKPLASMLAVLVAFLDRSFQRATEYRSVSTPPVLPRT